MSGAKANNSMEANGDGLIGKIRTWVIATSPSTLTSAFASVTLGASLSFYLYAKINILYYVITVAGIVLAQAGVNLVHDYSEYKTGLDVAHISRGLPHRIHPIINLGLDPKSVKRAGYLLLVISGIMGIYLAINTTWVILIIALAGFLFGVLYSEGLRLHYKGIGEAVALLSMGPLVSLGSFMVQATIFSWAPLLVGLINGLFTFIILLGSGAIEIDASREFGKKTIALMLGLRRTGYLAVISTMLIYIIIIISAIIGYLPYTSLLALLVMPFSIKLTIPLLRNSGAGNWKELKGLWAGPFNHRIIILAIIIASIIVSRLLSIP